jgi:hypothetical protein
MTTFRGSILVVVLAAAALACGGSDSGGTNTNKATASCDFAGSSDHGCVEWTSNAFTAAQNAELQSSCTQDHQGTYASSACPTPNRVGICTITASGVTFTTRIIFYSPMTADQSKQVCPSQTGVWSAP